jgi:hypothetical protein
MKQLGGTSPRRATSVVSVGPLAAERAALPEGAADTVLEVRSARPAREALERAAPLVFGPLSVSG